MVICRRSVKLLSFLIIGLLLSDVAISEQATTHEAEYSYRVMSIDGSVETVTTSVQWHVGGGHRVLTTIEQITGRSDIRLGGDEARLSTRTGPIGVSLLWLVLGLGAESGSWLDLAGVYGLAAGGMEPHGTYILPGGGLVRTRGTVIVAGLEGLEMELTHADIEDVSVLIVIPHDKAVTAVLPFPLRVEINYEGEGWYDESDQAVPFIGSIELVQFIADWLWEEDD